MNANTIVQKLWRLCAVLRKDGITYQQYVTELTYLLFLKMMAERDKEEGNIPEDFRWVELVKAEPLHKLKLYRQALTSLGDPEAGLPRTVHAIFDNAATFIREPQNLTTLVAAIDELEWFSDDRDQFGDLYEGLLQKNAEETKRGAGQYFTPRVLIELLVRLMKPQPGEIIQDPAAGTGGFLIAADKAMREATDDYFKLSPVQQEFQKGHAFQGMENVPGTLRLLLMNLHLHGVSSDQVDLGDTLSDKGKTLGKADLILTNPPFGPAGGAPTRDDLSVTATVSSYQLPFVEHCIRALKPGGRAAIVVPDNVLFEDGRGRQLRQMLMNWCDLHTILRLPTGIFYAQGVKTNVIFFNRGKTESDTTSEVWIYDLRAQMPKFGKTNQLTRQHLEDFEKAFGDDATGAERGADQGKEGRWRCFTREEIAVRDDNLDISWLREAEDEAEEGLTEPEEIAAAILGHLQTAMVEIEALSAELDECRAVDASEAAE